MLLHAERSRLAAYLASHVDISRSEIMLRAIRRIAPSDHVGLIYEVHFERALENLARKRMISFYRRVSKYSLDDRMQRDFYVHDKDGEIPFQVQSLKHRVVGGIGRQRALRDSTFSEFIFVAD